MSEPGRIQSLPQAIDALAPCPHGRYDDHLVSVLLTEKPAGLDGGTAAVVRTDHFCVTEHGRRIEVSHWLRPDQIDNNVAGLLADELFAPGWLSGSEIFERVFTGVVRSCIDGPLLAWCTFYGNTLARIRQCWRTAAPPGRPRADDDQRPRAGVRARAPAHPGRPGARRRLLLRLPALAAGRAAGKHGDRFRPVRRHHAAAESGGRRARGAGEHPGVRCGADPGPRRLGRDGERDPPAGARHPRARPRRARRGTAGGPRPGGGGRAVRGRTQRRVRPCPHL